ncbi:MAG: hypothetical protein MZV64_35285 [Ignavibacteriales bacterium]|nr:hypothetical protein [Ignavibacteriales bacterium]
MRALAPASLAVVVEHEARPRPPARTPCARRWRALLSSCRTCPGSGVRRSASLALATERACDEAAARRSGDRLRAAETILAVERLMQGAPHAAAVVRSPPRSATARCRREVLKKVVGAFVLTLAIRN